MTVTRRLLLLLLLVPPLLLLAPLPLRSRLLPPPPSPSSYGLLARLQSSPWSFLPMTESGEAAAVPAEAAKAEAEARRQHRPNVSEDALAAANAWTSSPSPSFPSPAPPPLDMDEAGRELCREARVLLTGLRGGPPQVARGALAAGLAELRRGLAAAAVPAQHQQQQQQHPRCQEEGASPSSSPQGLPSAQDEAEGGGGGGGETSAARGQEGGGAALFPGARPFFDPSVPFLAVVQDPRASGPHTLGALRALHRLAPSLVGAWSVPRGRLVAGVLRCKFEQTDAAVDEAVEMAIADLLGWLVESESETAAAVEGGSGSASCGGTYSNSASPNTLMDNAVVLDALSTVFVTRGAFAGASPSLAYHLETVLDRMVAAVFRAAARGKNSSADRAGEAANAGHRRERRAAVFDFLVSQLLGTPILPGDASSGGFAGAAPAPAASAAALLDDDALREVQITHDSTRILCLRLIRAAINAMVGPEGHAPASDGGYDMLSNDPAIVRTIQDDLCLALLMTGQAIWSHASFSTSLAASSAMRGAGAASASAAAAASSSAGAASSSGSDPRLPGGASASLAYVSLEALSEIASTLDRLWNLPQLRPRLVRSFQPVWTGLYTRALVLLRRRRVAQNPRHYHANLLFDEQVEIILESLVDMICLPASSSCTSSCPGGDNPDEGPALRARAAEAAAAAGGPTRIGAGTLENLFAYYDCNLNRGDVAADLFVELCRCCGGTVNEDGEAVLATLTPSSSAADLDQLLHGDGGTPQDGQRADAKGEAGHGRTPPNSAATSSVGAAASPSPPSGNRAAGGASGPASPALLVEHPLRPVPPHLKELCAQALVGAMRCLFRDDRPSEEALRQRASRKRSIMLRHVEAPILLSPEQGGGENNGPKSSDEANVIVAGVPDDAKDERQGGHYLRDLKSKKRLMRKAARIFNSKASRGIEFLLDAGLTPDPVTPASVAGFLRNGLVVGLDKRAVGAYLGEAGKSPSPGKSPPDWERDWFHKEVLKVYCSLFRFENQSLLDGLRMFLAAFRLPGEAQQIDRILQAFSDSCGQVCDESLSGRLKLFSEDPKRASDTAYLLSFSIIMLNTDRHNANIREDRKMSLDDFVKNNTDYGRDITEPGRAFPREYLKSIYDSINEVEIRTEGEGADGAMTVERWKDVLRGSTAEADSDDHVLHPSLHDAEDLTELILEHVWRPIVSALGALWGVRVEDDGTAMSAMQVHGHGHDAGQHTGMLGPQGARLGMDLAMEMLHGVRKLGRIDIFRKMFLWVCDYSGLLGEYTSDEVARTWAFTASVEGQSAAVVALTTAREAGEYLDEEGWKRVWLMLLELRDLKLIPLRSVGALNSILSESDQDLLTPSARSEWSICLVKGDMNFDVSKTKNQKPVSLFGAFGRALFGGDDREAPSGRDGSAAEKVKSVHGKDEMVLWDDCGLSDDESDDADEYDWPEEEPFEMSPGAAFEALLIRENLDMNKRMDMPVTGLERVDETRRYHDSPRARVRDRFRRVVDFKAIVTDSRFMDDSGVIYLLRALVDIVGSSTRPLLQGAPAIPSRRPVDRSSSGSSISSGNFTGLTAHRQVISPASAAFAEVLICEVALRNKDRLKTLWSSVLQDHYVGRLTSLLVSPPELTSTTGSSKLPGDPGLEKRVTGLLRLSLCALKREEVANDVLGCWKFVLPVNAEQIASSPLRVLDRHFGEGLWRIASETEPLGHNLNRQGWEGLVSLLTWASHRGCAAHIPAVVRRGPEQAKSPPFSDDDPALQAFRSAHLLVHSGDLALRVPISVVDGLRVLVLVGERRHYGQLGIASLDMMQALLDKRLAALRSEDAQGLPSNEFWGTWWRRVVEAIAGSVELSSESYVRQHALSVLTDLFLDKSGGSVPPTYLSGALSEVCVPLAGRRIVKLQMGDGGVHSSDELMIEFELCIGLIFKPLRHHLPYLLAASLPSSDALDGATASGTGGGEKNGILPLWKSILSALEELLGEDKRSSLDLSGSERHQEGSGASAPRPVAIPKALRGTMNNLAVEHLRNAIAVLMSSGLIYPDDGSAGAGSGASAAITSVTVDTCKRMGIAESSLKEWKKHATAGSS